MKLHNIPVQYTEDDNANWAFDTNPRKSQNRRGNTTCNANIEWTDFIRKVIKYLNI
jgi:hypothetical protein